MSRRPLIAIVLAASALLIAACGKQEISLDSGDHANTQVAHGALLFSQRCGGCHTLSAAGTQGSGNRGERTQGPNLNQREESYNDVLFAIENGGFSGAIMPQNIVVGKEAEAVAKFVAKYAGTSAENSPRPGQKSGPSEP